jgi:3-keto-disaccharide hydrolase
MPAALRAPPKESRMLVLSLVLTAALAADTPAKPAADAYLGRWNVRLTDADDTFAGGGFKVERKAAGLVGSIVWRFGSNLPAKTVEVVDGTLRLTREEKPGKADVFEASLDGDKLAGQVTYADGKVHHFEGKRAPTLAETGAPKWGTPVAVFDGKTLTGWALRDPKAKMGWAVVNGELAVVEPKGNADLMSDRKFQDMKLHLEFNVEPHSNSGVYLRGRYEIQILDDATKATEEHGCGALYSRIAPKLDANKPAGEWETFDITFVGRRLTVVLNGKAIIDNAEVDGITGGAINPFEGEPGPLMLQGDHGKVRFRNITVTPGL